MRCDYGDGSFDAAVTILYDALKFRPAPAMICLSDPEVRRMDMEYRFVEADAQKVSLLQQALISRAGEEAWHTLWVCWLSELPEAPGIMLAFTRQCFKLGASAVRALGIKEMMQAERIRRRVEFEAHRFKGYIRFMRLQNGLYYAAIEPDHNILPLIAPHFVDRFADQPILIHDRKRSLYLLACGGRWQIGQRSEDMVQLIRPDEDAFTQLWRTFFDSVAIESRRNPRLQRQFVPLKYRKHMPEFQ